MMGPMMGGWGGSWGALGWLWMILMWLVPIGIIVGLAYLFINLSSGRSAAGRNPVGVTEVPESALDVLKKRYARGEITSEDFRRMKHELLED